MCALLQHFFSFIPQLAFWSQLKVWRLSFVASNLFSFVHEHLSRGKNRKGHCTDATKTSVIGQVGLVMMGRPAEMRGSGGVVCDVYEG